MDLHNYYLRFSTLDIALLRTVNDSSMDDRFVLHHLIQFYNQQLTGEELDMSKLEMCRMLLCYEYQLIFGAVDNHDKIKYSIPANARTICFSDIGEIFPLQHVRSTSEILVLRDIIILQMTLYCDAESAKQHLQSFLNLNEGYVTNSDVRVTYMKILEYLLEFLQLYKFLHDDTSEGERKEVLRDLASVYLKVVKLWIRTKEDSEWSLFATIFPKLVETFASEYILHPLWDYVFEMNDLEGSLIILSIMVDTCFTSPCMIDVSYILRNIYSEISLWSLILKGLRSPLQQHHKQALYIMKKATDINDLQESAISLKLNKAKIAPFICSNPSHSTCKSIVTNLCTDDVKQKFFLVYEALNEKQYHLVGPALTHVTSLINFNRSYSDCFDVIWLQCILEKVLQHKNNNVVKWGVSCICKLDETIFDDRFLETFVDTLTNTYLYECQLGEECPEIVRELAVLLGRAGKTNLLNRFLQMINRITWGPVAIFYLVHTLRIVSHDGTQCVWLSTELDAVRSLVAMNLIKHSQILRVASQIELLRAIPGYVRRVDDVLSLANMLTMFPHGEGLTRGTIPWNVVATWLAGSVTREDAAAFAKDICAKFMSRESNDPAMSPKAFALMIYLLHDANLVLVDKICATERAIYDWLYTFQSIHRRPYAEFNSCLDTAEFLSHMLSLSGKNKFGKRVRNLITSCIHDAFEFFIKNMSTIPATIRCYADYERYTDVVSSCIANAIPFVSKVDLIHYTERLQNRGADLLSDSSQDRSVQYLYGLHIIYLAQNVSVVLHVKNLCIEYVLDLPPDTLRIINNLTGRYKSEYYLLVPKLLYQYVINQYTIFPTHTEIDLVPLLHKLLQCLDLGTIEIVTEVAMVLTVIVDKAIVNDKNRKTFERVFTLAWKSIIDSKKNNIFWTALQNLTGVIINDNFLPLPDAMSFVTEFVDRLIEEGNNTPRFKRILLSKMEKLNECNLLKLDKWLLSCLLHGSVLRRDQKIENHTHLFIAKHLARYYPRHILACDQNNDAAVRAQAIVLLHKMINHSELNYTETIVSLIFETLENYKSKRYFNDSFLHRLKHRSMQVLLILAPVLNKESIATLQENLCDLILSESDQPSVKLMLEWLMIRIFKNRIDLHNRLWNFFAECIKKRPSCTISVASIVYHVAQFIPECNQRDFISTALPFIAQCCLGQQFNIRLCNQFVLIKLYELMVKTNGDCSVLEYKGIYQAAAACLQQENSTRNSIKMQDNFYFSSFHPFYDYSLQTIYYELPRLTGVNCDEWISPDVFESFAFEENFNHPLKLNNIKPFLSEIETSVYLTRTLADDTESLANHVETYLEGLHDIQKKNDPSRSALYNNIFEAMKKSMCQNDFRLHDDGLIVVASFVNRPPNLGGITRTCEIFGVKTLVIANVDCLKDKEFQCLSVSAERWINMLQVKPYELQNYLLEKKNAGWSLIGVEQTANSINLLETKFEKRTILVLGNEKDGIPANFIPLFNTCVEIPQAGVIRSLNVHVTAAICIWQYASQHTLK